MVLFCSVQNLENDHSLLKKFPNENRSLYLKKDVQTNQKRKKSISYTSLSYFIYMVVKVSEELNITVELSRGDSENGN